MTGYTPPELTEAVPGQTIWYRQGFDHAEREVVAFFPGDRYNDARVVVVGSEGFRLPATWFTAEAPQDEPAADAWCVKCDRAVTPEWCSCSSYHCPDCREYIHVTPAPGGES